MKIVGFMPVHYGLSYIYYAIRSVIDVVDAFYCIYTPVGSFGWQTSVPCPETEAELLQAAAAAAGGKLRWGSGLFANEAQHRDVIYTLEPDADIVLCVDADHIWLKSQLEALLRAGKTGSARVVRARGIHFWRSFYRAVIDDYAAPVHLICPKIPAGEVVADAFFAHMGYAQPESITEYKQWTHGHRGEWRHDWFETRFLPNAQRDVHPTGIDYWHPQPVNPRDYLPDWVVDEHPFAKLDVITDGVQAR